MTAAPVRRGRPRSEAIDAAIVDATIEELIERGYSGLSIESIALRAGVARTTVYRRWDDPLELALTAMRRFEEPAGDPPPGPVREQLCWLLDRLRRKWHDPRYAAIMRRAAADGTATPQLYALARDRLIAPSIAQMNTVLRRGMAEGVIRRDLDVDWVRRLLVSPILAAALTHKERISTAQVRFTVDTVLRGTAP